MKTTTILQHIIEYNFFEEDKLELNDIDREHIAYQITEGYSEGELCQSVNSETGEEEARGYWKIKR